LLENHFSDLVYLHFTARMEQTLDDIAVGKTDWLPYLGSFYRGDDGLANQVQVRQDNIDPSEARTVNFEELGAKIRIGRYGAYAEVEHEGELVRASLPETLNPADVTVDQIQEVIRQKTEGPDALGLHPETGEAIYVLTGRYGPYVQLGEVTEEVPKPKRASLPKGVTTETVTLDLAVGLLALPRLLGEHPETGKPVKASLGRFGPYVVHDQGKDGKDYRSIKGDDDVTTITFERALELLAQPKAGRGRKKEPLRELGPHPEDNEPVNIYKGPYGIYVQHNKVNAGLAEGQTLEDLTMEQAIALLDAKAATKKTTRKKSTAKKKTTTKKATKSTTAKKTTTKKTTAKKSTTTKATKTTAAKTTTAKTTAAKKTTPKRSTAKKTAANEPKPAETAAP
ncbi:MAG: topoisomerase C-terminal repeat-containing protein, partial [Cyanobacteria bacterium P01_H01_bin.130]